MPPFLCEWLVGGPGGGGFNECRLVALGEWPSWVVVLAAIAAIAATVVGWLGVRTLSVARRRRVLIGLRLAAAALALVLVLQPGLALEDVERVPSRVLVLVDESASMTLADRPDARRIDDARAFLSDNRTFFEALAEEHAVVGMAVSDRAEPTPLALLRDPARDASGRGTFVRRSLLEVAGGPAAAGRAGAGSDAALPGDAAGGRLGGVIVISDGAEGDVPADAPMPPGAATALSALGVPVHTFAAGRPDEFKDIGIAELYTDDFAFVRNTVEVEAVVEVAGFERLDKLDVELRKEGALVLRKVVPPGSDPAKRHVAFSLVPDQVGTFVYSVGTPLLPGEATAVNNEREFVLEIIRDKIRVLQVSGAPSWDERFLRKLLKKDPNVDLVSFFILRAPSDDALAPTHELSLIPFPTDELFGSELPGFDVVIFQNFNYRPYGMSLYLDEVLDYVEGGGGFVMIGGDLSFGAGGYTGTPVEAALPFSLVGWGAGTVVRGAPVVDGAFTPRVTSAGTTHPITALGVSADETARLFAELPPLLGLNAVGHRAADTTVLLEHPTAKTFDGEPAPLVAVRDIGKGRSMAITTDTLWRWNFEAVGTGGSSQVYYDLWGNALRWLIKDPELSLLRLAPDRRRYAVGDAARIEVRAFTPAYAPAADVAVSLEVDPPGDGPLFEVAIRTGDDGVALHELPLGAAGAWRLRARATIEGRSVEAFTALVAQLAGRELERPAPRHDMLAAMAEATGGEARTLPVSLDEDDVDDMELRPASVVRINRRRDLPLWDTAWTVAIVALLLGGEWWLRRRWGLL